MRYYLCEAANIEVAIKCDIEVSKRPDTKVPYATVLVRLWPYLITVIKYILDIQSAEVGKASLSRHLTRDFFVETDCAQTSPTRL